MNERGVSREGSQRWAINEVKSERVFKTKGSGYVQRQVGSSQGRKRNREDVKGVEKSGSPGFNGG